MATRSSVLAWRISRKEEPGGLQSTRSHRLRHELTVVPQGTGSRKLLLRGPSLQPCPQEQAASCAEGPGGQHSAGEGGSVLEGPLEGLHATIQAWCCDRPRRAGPHPQ